MRPATFVLSAAACLVVLPNAAATSQQTAQPYGPNFHKLLSMDSTGVGGAGMSPNGRWIVFTHGATLWIMPSDGHAKPHRLLSPGYRERYFEWFASSDRIVFASNRASRDGQRKMYGMTVTIDPNTGEVNAPPRQITTEEILAVGSPSPDGKWVPYLMPNETAIKLVPANGGTARTLVTMDGVHLPIRWSRDGKTVFFPVGTAGENSPPSGVFYKVSRDGGPVTRAYSDSTALAYGPNQELHIALIRVPAHGAIRRAELRDSNDKLLGVADVPSGMDPWFSEGTLNGFLGTVVDSRYEAHIVPVTGGASRVVSVPDDGWIEGWTSDGTGLIADGTAMGMRTLEELDLTGRMVHRVELPDNMLGTGDGVVGAAMMISRWSTSGSVALDLVDVRSGAVREIVPRASELRRGSGVRVTGRGTSDTDGDRFLRVMPNGSMLEFRALKVDGTSILLRSFPLADSVFSMAAHGDRIAWARRTPDSVRFFAARGGGPVHEIAARSRRDKPGWLNTEMVWSNDGRSVAFTGGPKESSIGVVRVDDQCAPVGPASFIGTGGATGLWSPQWLLDDQSLLVIGTPMGAKQEEIIRIPVNGRDAATSITRPEDNVGDDALYLSPDGKFVAYPYSYAVGASIWRIDFVPPKK